MRSRVRLTVLLLLATCTLAIAPGAAVAREEMTEAEMDTVVAAASRSSLSGNIGSGPNPIEQACTRNCRASGNIGFAIKQSSCLNNCKASGNIGAVGGPRQTIVIR